MSHSKQVLFFNIPEFEFEMNEDEKMDILGAKDKRGKKERKRQQKESKRKESTSEESYKKLKEELEEWKNKAIEYEKKNKEEKTQEGYALEFKKEEYLAMGFMESSHWVAKTLAKRLNSKIREEKKYEFMFKLSGQITGARTCARYNRGEECNLGKWHTSVKKLEREADTGASRTGTSRTFQRNSKQGAREELRLHACTLCSEAFGLLSEHMILSCPWIQPCTWKD